MSITKVTHTHFYDQYDPTSGQPPSFSTEIIREENKSLGDTFSQKNLDKKSSDY